MTKAREQQLLDLEHQIHGSRAAASIVGNLVDALIATADPATSGAAVKLTVEERDIDALARAVADLLAVTEDAHAAFYDAAKAS